MKKKSRYSLSLDSEIVRAVRARFPGASVSAAVENALRLFLERSDLAERARMIEIFARAVLIMLSEHITGDEKNARRLAASAAQKAMDRMKKVEERRGVAAGAGAGPADKE